MSAQAAASAGGRRFRRARGIAAGLVASFGALVAHVAGGGSVETVPGLVVLGVTVPLAVLLSRPDVVDARRLTAIAVVAQGVGHACLMMAPAGHAHDHGHAATGAVGAVGTVGTGAGAATAPELLMVLLHLGVAAATIGVAAGVDRAMLDLVRALLGWLLPRFPRLLTLPVPHRGRAGGRVRLLASQVGHRAYGARGPPSRRTASPLCAVH